MSEEKIKCAIIGYGYWGQILEKYIRSSKLFDLKYICDVNADQIISVDYILKDETIVAVFICTPADNHFDMVKQALLASKHVFCEKPLAKCLAEVNELVVLSKKVKRCLYTDYIYTVSPSINFIKKHLNSVGGVKSIRGNIEQFGKFYLNDDIYDVLGVHLIAAILYILDDYDISDVDIVFNHSSYYNEKQKPLDCELIYKTSSGIVVTITCNLLSNCKMRSLQLFGDSGGLKFDMLGEETYSKYVFNKYNSNYIIKERMSELFDEGNNLVFAVEDFCDRICSHKVGNIQITLGVSQLLEKIRFWDNGKGNLRKEC